MSSLSRLYPAPQSNLSLEGLYLEHALHSGKPSRRSCVYTNYVASLDGRIAIEHPLRDGHTVPESIANPRDWRLYQELAAQADVLVTSARYFRELSEGTAQDNLPLSQDAAFSDLHAWRREQGLAPQPAVVILSTSLDLPLVKLCESMDRSVYVATGDDADPKALAEVEASGARVLFSGEGTKVDGRRLIDNLLQEGFSSIYSIAGPGILKTLLQAGVLDRLYLTQVHRLIGGKSFDTLLESELIQPPADFELQALYYDAPEGDDAGQFFSVYEAVRDSNVV